MNDVDNPRKRYPDKPPLLHRLVLTGFMGAGKSTVGAMLARALGWQFVDLDAHIEASSKLTVAEIFRDHGEESFRQRERDAVKLLSRNENIVLALGGGTIEDEFSRAHLLATPGTCLVFLEGNLAELIARCSAEGSVRPLLASASVMEARHARRLPFYRMSHVTVVTTGLTPQQVADRVLERTKDEWRLEAIKKVGTHGSS